MRPVRWRRVRSSEDGLPFEPVVVTQAGRGKLAGAKEPSQRIRRMRELTMGVVVSQQTNEDCWYFRYWQSCWSFSLL